MSSSVFPAALPIRDIEIVRSTIYPTTIHTAPSGREDRTSWSATPRYQWRCRFNALRGWVAAPSPWQAYSEAGVVQHFIELHYANFDSFHWIDPWDGTTDRVVRFKEGTVALTRIFNNIWKAEFELISVL